MTATDEVDTPYIGREKSKKASDQIPLLIPESRIGDGNVEFELPCPAVWALCSMTGQIGGDNCKR